MVFDIDFVYAFYEQLNFSVSAATARLRRSGIGWWLKFRANDFIPQDISYNTIRGSVFYCEIFNI